MSHNFYTQAVKALVPKGSKYKSSEFADGTHELVWDEDNSTDKPTDEAIKAKAKEIKDGIPAQMLRYERSERLKETDWMANSDVTMSDAWKKYRQDLRDLPANTADPSNPTWPTKPS